MNKWCLEEQNSHLNASLNRTQSLIGPLRRELHHVPCSIRVEFSPRELTGNDVTSLERYDSALRGLGEDQRFSDYERTEPTCMQIMLGCRNLWFVRA